MRLADRAQHSHARFRSARRNAEVRLVIDIIALI
jgi:hypothetical protein